MRQTLPTCRPHRPQARRLGILVLLTTLGLTFVASPGVAGSRAKATDAASPAAQAFDQLKKLEGHWQGRSSSGAEVEIHYSLTGQGTALVERYAMTEHPEMVTVYHLDGDSILLTHYCVGNQPRMRASTFGTDGELRFDFVDVSGLDTDDEGHMHHALVRYTGGDTMSSDWTYHQSGAAVFTESVEVERVSELAAR